MYKPHSFGSQASNDALLQPYVSDIVKEFKANGNFDQFRKELVCEIVSQSDFSNLNRQVGEFVQNIMKDSLYANPSIKKSDVKDAIRQKLNASHFLTNGINTFINQMIDIKKEEHFKPIVNKMVDAMATQSIETIKASKMATSTESQDQKTGTINNKISIEDFLQSTEKTQPKPLADKGTAAKPSALATTTKASIDLSSKKPKPIKKEPEKLDISVSAQPASDKKQQHVEANSADQSTGNLKTKAPQIVDKTSPAITNTQHLFDYAKYTNFSMDPPLASNQQDRTYNFDWKLDDVVDKQLMNSISSQMANSIIENNDDTTTNEANLTNTS